MDPEDFTASLESFLLNEPGDDGWFREAQIVERFALQDDRYLRANGSIPGPLSRCTIFSSRGIKHIQRATTEEIEACQKRVDAELRSRVYRRRWLREAIARCLDGNTERHTGQTVTTTEIT